MHIVIILALLLSLVFLLYQAFRPADHSANESATDGAGISFAPSSANRIAGLDVAFISDGKLFYQADDQVKQLHSPYIQEVADRMERSRNMHAWKQDTSFQFGASGRIKQFDSNAHIVATSAQFDQNRSILYFLKDDSMGGLFSYDFDSGTEVRLLHKQNLNLNDLNLDRDARKMLCSSVAKNGVANIVMLNSDGSQFRELTGGDTYDSCPAWIPGESKEILYQSAGLARDEKGFVVAQGHASIQRLDMKSANVTPVLEDRRYDFLQPRVCPQGNLHFIRRPYEPPKYGTGNLLLDTLLFPFRLLRVIFHFLNFFSMMYSRKPLTSASGPALQTDLKQLILKGKRIDAEKALRSETRIDGVTSLVPKSWQLMRRTRDGDQVLATNVVSYDVTHGGDIVYSNGRGVFLLGSDAGPKLILKSDVVADVIAQVAQARQPAESEHPSEAAGP